MITPDHPSCERKAPAGALEPECSLWAVVRGERGEDHM